MKGRVGFLGLAVVMVMSGFGVTNAWAMSGKTKSSCETLLCLSASGGRPGACGNPLKEFYSIKHRRPDKQIKKRKNFLKLCPTDFRGKEQLVNYASEGWGERCEINRLPSICREVAAAQFTLGVVLPVMATYCMDIPSDSIFSRRGQPVCIQQWMNPEAPPNPAQFDRLFQGAAFERCWKGFTPFRSATYHPPQPRDYRNDYTYQPPGPIPAYYSNDRSIDYNYDSGPPTYYSLDRSQCNRNGNITFWQSYPIMQKG